MADLSSGRVEAAGCMTVRIEADLSAGRAEAAGCMAAGVEADLSAGWVESAGCIAGGFEAVLAACAVWAGGWEAAVVEAALAAWVAGARGYKAAGKGPVCARGCRAAERRSWRKDSCLNSIESMGSAVACLCFRREDVRSSLSLVARCRSASSLSASGTADSISSV